MFSISQCRSVPVHTDCLYNYAACLRPDPAVQNKIINISFLNVTQFWLPSYHSSSCHGHIIYVVSRKIYMHFRNQGNREISRYVWKYMLLSERHQQICQASLATASQGLSQDFKNVCPKQQFQILIPAKFNSLVCQKGQTFGYYTQKVKIEKSS